MAELSIAPCVRLVLLVLAVPLAVEAQFTYTTTNGAITITGYTGYTGPGGELVIPDTLDGLPVTTIGEWAFLDFTGLTNVAIPDSVTSIGGHAFADCTSLANAIIPSSVTNIGDTPFADCYSLSAITVDAANPAYTSVDGVLFDKDVATLIQYPAGKTGSYAVPIGVTSILASASERAFELTDLAIPDSVTNIGMMAFKECGGLTNLCLPNQLREIQFATFEWCSGLTSISIPDSVTSIDEQAFCYCTYLVRVAIGNGVTNMDLDSFGQCLSLGQVFFQGDAPAVVSWNVFRLGDGYYNKGVTVYFLPGTTGWGPTFSRCPTAVWKPQIQSTVANFGVQTNGFGFNTHWASGMTVVVEATPNLSNPTWTPLATNTLTSGSAYFSDPQWTNYPSRFYRLRWP